MRISDCAFSVVANPAVVVLVAEGELVVGGSRFVLDSSISIASPLLAPLEAAPFVLWPLLRRVRFAAGACVENEDEDESIAVPFTILSRACLRVVAESSSRAACFEACALAASSGPKNGFASGSCEAKNGQYVERMEVIDAVVFATYFV